MRYLYLAIWLFLVAVTATGCSDGADNEATCNAGGVGCRCYPNKTCNDGLSCRSALCVNLNDGAPAPTRTVKGAQTTQGGSEGYASTAGAGAGHNAGGGGAVSARRPDSGGTVAGAAGHALEGCTQQCGDAECGPDPACQKSCGDCASGLECKSGICKAPVPLRKNGETCASSEDCASRNCGRNRVGEMLCYGTAQPNDPCRDTFDCSEGACLEKIAGSAALVCVPGITECVDLGVDECTGNLAIASCQFNELCGKATLDFNSCVQFSCMYWMENPPTNVGCPAQLAFYKGGKGNCSK